jgi:hypothetical protein
MQDYWICTTFVLICVTTLPDSFLSFSNSVREFLSFDLETSVNNKSNCEREQSIGLMKR